MNWVFGKSSKEKLATCNPNLVAVAQYALAVSPYDFTIVHGWRGEDVQNALYDRRASQKPWPDSKHNVVDQDGNPASDALDFAPIIEGVIYWDDTDIFCVVAGSFLVASKELNIPLRWGGDWDGDGRSKGDQTFMDYGHVEVLT